MTSRRLTEVPGIDVSMDASENRKNWAATLPREVPTYIPTPKPISHVGGYPQLLQTTGIFLSSKGRFGVSHFWCRHWHHAARRTFMGQQQPGNLGPFYVAMFRG